MAFQLDNRLPMMGYQPDLVNTLAQSNQAAAQQNEFQQQNALRRFMADNGQAVYAGDENALGQFARFSPEGALNIRNTRDAMAERQERLKLAQAAGARAARAARLSEQQAAQAAQEFDQLRKLALLRQSDPQAFAQGLNTLGLAQQGVSPENFDLYLATAQGAASAIFEGVRAARPPEPKLTDDMREFQYAQENPAFGAFLRGNRAAGATTVNVNGDQVDTRPIVASPDKGFQRRWDAERQTWVDEPIPGSAVAQDQTQSERAMEMANADYQRKFDIVDGAITRALTQLEDGGRFVAGVGSLLSGVPESGARDFQATLDTVKANLGFEELQAMRDSSPSGGALGQVSEREIAFLQAIQGNLDAAQSPEQLAEVLTEIQTRRREFAAERQRILRGQSAQGSVPQGVDPEDWKYMTEDERALFK